MSKKQRILDLELQVYQLSMVVRALIADLNSLKVKVSLIKKPVEQGNPKPLTFPNHPVIPSYPQPGETHYQHPDLHRWPPTFMSGTKDYEK